MGRQRGGFGARDLRGKRRGARRVCGERGRLCPLQIQALAFQSAALEFQSAALENQSAALKNQIAELWRQGGGRRGQDWRKEEWDGRMGAGRSAAAATISLIGMRVYARGTQKGALEDKMGNILKKTGKMFGRKEAMPYLCTR